MNHNSGDFHEPAMDSTTGLPYMAQQLPLHLLPQPSSQIPQAHQQFASYMTPVAPSFDQPTPPMVSPVANTGGPVFSSPPTPIGINGFNIDFAHRPTRQIPFHPHPVNSAKNTHSMSPVMLPSLEQSAFDTTSFQVEQLPQAAFDAGGVGTAQTDQAHVPSLPPISRISSRTILSPHAHLKESRFVPTSLPPIKSGQVFQIHEEDSNSPVESTPPPPPVSMTSQFLNSEPSLGGFHTVRSEPSFPRMASMMEQVYKPASDDLEIDPPQKKRRMDPGFNAPRPSSSGRSSAIPDPDKAYEEILQQQPFTQCSSSNNTVDLTNNKYDEDVQVYNPLDEEVCYGCIEGILHCTIVPSPKPGAKCLFGVNWFPTVKIVLKKKSGDGTHLIHAYDHTRNIVGRLDSQVSKALAPLVDSNMKMRTDCRINSRQKMANEVPGQPFEKDNLLEINIYGPARYINYIGECFHRHHIVLRPPQFVQPGIKVMNPHKAVPKPTVRPPIRSYSLTAQPAYQSIGTRSAEEVRNEVQGIFDSMKSNNLPESEPSDIIITPLLQHQRQGLHFMQNRERSDICADAALWPASKDRKGRDCFRNVLTNHLCVEPPLTRGGILADMMGLGKTLSTLSLVAGSLEESRAWAVLDPVQPSQPPPNPNAKSWPSTGPSLGLTRIVCNTRATLLVCPLSTITNWEEQIKAHIKPGALSYYIYHGSNRIKDVETLADFDLVITTYGSISSELGLRSKGKPGQYPLEELGWFRIVLDEAHMIREQTTLQFKAITRLQANRRWAVTGTPVQNRLDDFAALLQFIRLRPFDDRAKFNRFIVEPFKMCDPNIVPKLRILVDTVTLRRFKDKIDLPERTDEIVRLKFSDEERYIYQLFSKDAQDRVQALSAGGEKALSGHTYIHILRSILRLRLICAHGRDLLNQEDLRVMQGMTADMAIDLDGDDDDTVSDLSERKAHEMYELMQETNNDGCISCNKKLSIDEGADEESETDLLGYMNPCFHVICRGCYRLFRQKALARLNGAPRGPCQVCSSVVSATFVSLYKSKLSPEHNGVKGGESTTISNSSSSATLSAATKRAERLQAYRGPSTKVRALLEDLLASKAKSLAAPSEPPYKSVVFSGWTSHLDLIQVALDDAGLKYVRLDGTMSRAMRSAAMEAFREDPSVDVILVSISAGGLGLNLTAGNSVYVMEPQYNPAAEAQAIDRVHRLGQKRPVRTVRYIMEDSFEERMLELQDKKKKLASLSMDGRDKALDKGDAALQKLKDIRSLFR
ncbi:hypothetical protein TD95_003199 [Thielaviopsis punctulata]|uniref:Uncharacterized protein n=1 Tax=Thielaviopsis punctulata TaxID=72032 RepID=A0A0F4Z9Y3_9PEZI|nr:hypothetical protein TD95_003199 [Thielaviopsis punctulata]